METRPISKTKKFRLFKIVNTKHKESKIWFKEILV
jgi:hypothetical protein